MYNRINVPEEDSYTQPPSYPITWRGSYVSLGTQVKNRGREAVLDVIASLLTKNGLPPRHADGSLQVRRRVDTPYPLGQESGTHNDPITVI
jgi:hypothetical protein